MIQNTTYITKTNLFSCLTREEKEKAEKNLLDSDITWGNHYSVLYPLSTVLVEIKDIEISNKLYRFIVELQITEVLVVNYVDMEH